MRRPERNAGWRQGVPDGEDAVSPLFCAMADTAEQEVMEEEVPFMQLVSKRLVRDNQGFGKYTRRHGLRDDRCQPREPPCGAS